MVVEISSGFLLFLCLTVEDDRGVGSVGNRVGNADGSVGNNVDGSGVSVTSLGGLRVAGGSGVGDLSDESLDVVGVVVGGLDPAVGEGNGVRASDVSVLVLGLGLLEVVVGVVVGNSVVVGEGLGLLLVDGGSTVAGGGGGGGGSGQKSRGKDNLQIGNHNRNKC